MKFHTTPYSQKIKIKVAFKYKKTKYKKLENIYFNHVHKYIQL